MTPLKNILSKVILILGMTFGVSVIWAQNTKVIVLDGIYSQPIPSAHVKFINIKTGESQYVITNLNGLAVLPTETTYGKQIKIHVSFIGMKPVNQTITKGTTTKIKLLDDVELLNQVVVTGQYSASSPEKAVHKISLITRDKIDQLNAVSLDQVLARELNMNISQDGVLGSSISIQGLSGENVKILVDGVPMIGRLNGSIDLSQINLSDVERIEVVEGPLSVSYGSNALAGTINIITKKGQKKPFSANAKIYTENIGTTNVDAGLGFSKGKNFGAVNFTRNYFDGWNMDDPVFGQPSLLADSSRSKLWKPRTQYLGGVKLGRTLENGTLIYNIDAFNETILNRGLPRGPYGETAFDDKYITNRIDNNITLDLALDSLSKLNILGAYNYYERKKLSYITDLTGVSSIENPTKGANDTTKTDLIMLRSTYSNQPKGKNWRYQIGIDLNNETAKGARILDQKQSIGDYAAFTSVELEPGDKWIVRPGIRFSYNTKYGAPVVPSLNIKFLPKSGMAVRFSVARGFRAPSVKELYLDFVDINHDIHGNPDLTAETAIHTSANFTYTKLEDGRMYKFKSGIFYNHIKNKIALAQASPTKYVYANVDEALSLGFNIEAQTTIKHFKGSLGFSYTGIKNTITDAAETPELAFYPQVTSNLSYDFKKAKTNISLFVKYSGELPQFVIDANNNIEQQYIGAYTLMDFTASKKLWKDRLILGAGVKNILNVTNVSSGSSSGAHGGTNGTRPIAPGRVYFLKLGFQL